MTSEEDTFPNTYNMPRKYGYDPINQTKDNIHSVSDPISDSTNKIN